MGFLGSRGDCGGSWDLDWIGFGMLCGVTDGKWAHERFGEEGGREVMVF